MDWSTVGKWVQENAGTGAALVGSLLTGNAPGAVAAGIALVSSAAGTTDPAKALEQMQKDPAVLLKLRELAQQNEADIRAHVRAMAEAELKDKQAEHHEQQETIRGGDQAIDEYVRRTRPRMARQSWYAAAGYVIVFEAMKAAGVWSGGAVFELAMLLVAPAGAYLGFRTWDKRSAAQFGKD